MEPEIAEIEVRALLLRTDYDSPLMQGELLPAENNYPRIPVADLTGKSCQLEVPLSLLPAGTKLGDKFSVFLEKK